MYSSAKPIEFYHFPFFRSREGRSKNRRDAASFFTGDKVQFNLFERTMPYDLVLMY